MYLDGQGAEDTIILTLNGNLGPFKKFVIASARSRRHIRKMSESIVASVS